MTYITEKEFKEYNKELNLETIRSFSERISGNVEFAWGYKECEEYLNNLVNGNPEGNCQWFPKEVSCAMMNLLRQHQEEYK